MKWNLRVQNGLIFFLNPNRTYLYLLCEGKSPLWLEQEPEIKTNTEKSWDKLLPPSVTFFRGRKSVIRILAHNFLVR